MKDELNTAQQNRNSTEKRSIRHRLFELVKFFAKTGMFVLFVVLGWGIMSQFDLFLSVVAAPNEPPTASTPVFISQETDGTGYVTVSTQLQDIDDDDLTGKVEYSVDGSTWYAASIATTSISANLTATSTYNNGNSYQVSLFRGIGPIQSANTSTLELLYNMDDASGSIVDSSGNSRTGTNNGATYGASGKFGTSLDFSSDFVQSPQFTLGNTFTVMAWVNSDVADQGSYNRIMENLYSSHFYLGTESVGTGYKLIVKNASSPFGTAQGGTISTTAWQHVLGTYDGTTGKLYVDGSFVASGSFTAPGNVSDDIFIGRNSASAASYWDGQIDEVAVFSETLSTDAISSIVDGSFVTSTLAITIDTKTSATSSAYAGTLYVRVTPRDSLQDGSVATSTGFSIDNQAPTGLANFATSSSPGSSIDFSWDPVTETNFDRYEIWYSNDASTGASDAANRTGTASQWTTSSDANLSTTSTANTTITGLSINNTYYFSIFAIDDYGNVATTTQVTVSIPGLVPAAATPAFSQQASDASGYVTFTVGTSDSDTVTTSHKFEYSLDGGSTWSDMHIQSVSSDQGNTVLDNDASRQITTGVSTNTAPYDPIVLMHMDDADTSITDTAGNYTGTYNGALLSQSGKFGSAIGYDGSDDTINLGDVSELNSASSFTIMGWFKQTTLSQDRGLFAKDAAEGANSFIFGRTLTDGILYSYINNGTAHRGYFTYTGVGAATWFHYALVYDGSLTGDANREKVYINGEQQSQTFTGGTGIPATTPDLSGKSFHIGGSVSTVSNIEWLGDIDEFAIFTQPLSSSEVADIYANELALTTTTLTVVWDTKSTSNGGGSFTGSTTTAQIRVTPNDGSQDGSAITSANFSVDNQAPTNLANLAVVTTSTLGTTKLSWDAVTETNFDRYDIWYGSSSSDVEGRSGSATQWTTSSDANLATAGTTSTTLTNLPGGTLYYSVFAIDDYSNTATTTQVSATIERDFISTQTGDWNVGTTWGGSCSSSCTAGTDFPTSTDDVIVTSTHTVSIPTATTASFGTLTIRGTANLTLVGNIDTGTNITIETGATLEQKNTTTQTISGTLTIDSGGTLTHTANTTAQNYEIDFSATTISIAGTVSANGKGFQGGQSSGASGEGTGAGTGNGTGAGGGAGYGGAGGTSSNSTAGGVTYGTTSTPGNLGSGGGAGGAAGATGGAGGGLVQLTAATISLTGSIVANGSAGVVSTQYAGGGGSGGGIYINPSTSFTGNGTITANGGNGGDGTSHDGGGGGGGRIAIGTFEGPLAFTGTFSATSGVGPGTANDGGVGTIYIRPDSAITNLTTSSYTNFTWGDTISGTSTDHDDTPASVDLRIQRSSDSYYWNGSIWVESETWVVATGDATWSYTLATANLTDGVTYTISSRATDDESEVESSYGSDSFSFSTVANTLPTATVPSPYQVVSSTRGVVIASTTVSDANLTDTTTTIEYSLNNGSSWASATLGDVSISDQSSGFSTSSGKIVGIDTSAGDKTVTFYWLSYLDANEVDISTAKLRIIPNDSTEDGSAATSSAFALDTSPPSGLGTFVVGSYTSEQVHLTWDAVTDTNFGHYEIWYGTTQSHVQGRSDTAVEWDNSDDVDLLTASSASTTITGLSPNTYYFKIFGIDDFYNESTVADINTTNSNTLASSTISRQPSQSTDGTQIISFTATIQDTDATQTNLLIEHSADGSSWSSSTIRTVIPDSGSVTTSTGQISGIDTDVATNNTVALTITLSASTIFSNTSDDTVYIRVTPQDSYANGTVVTSSAFVVDTVNPTAPGSFVFSTSTTSTITFTYGTASTEDHFVEYRVYYKQAASGVTISDSEITSTTDANLGSRTFNSETDFVLSGLSPNLPYTLTIKAFDSYGNVSSLTTETSEYSAPAVPNSLSVSSVDEETLLVSWNENENPSGSIYYLAYSDDTFIVTTTATSTNVTIETPGQEYTFKVRTQYAASTTQYSAYSATASGSTTLTAPNAPTDVTASSVSTSSLTIAWTDTNNYEDNYIVKYGTSSGSYPTTASTTAENTTSTSITGLTPNQTYYFVIVAQNSAGSATSSPEVSTTTISLAPDAPTGVSFSSVQSSSLTVSWTDTTSGTNAEDNFIVKYGTVEGVYETTASTTVANVTSTSVSGLTDNTLYYFVILATNEAGTATSSAVSTTTLVTAATAPSNLAVSSVSTSSLTLSWTDNADNESSQTVFYDTDNSSFNNNVSLLADATSTSISGLTPNTRYYFKVRAANAGGSNDSSVTSTYSTANVPTILTITAVSYDRISLTWSANSNPAGTVFEVTQVNGSDTLIATTTDTEYTITGLTSETTYTFKVRAINADASGYSDYSAPEAEATTSVDPPTAPTSTLSNVASSTLTVSWTDNSSGSEQETSFTVKYGTASGVYGTTVTTTVADVTSTPVTGLSPNTVYYVVVLATNGSGSTTSTEVSTTTLIYAPSAPTATVQSTTATTLSLSWTDPNADDTQEADFLIEYGTDSGNLASSTTATADSTSKTLTSLTPNSTYYVRVTARNSAGSAASDIVSGATSIGTPPKPTVLNFTNVSTSTLSLSWTDNSSDNYQESSFVVAYTTNGTDYTTASTTIADVTSVSVSSLTPNTTYVFRVTASNASGSGVSDTETTTTIPIAPAAASALAILNKDSSSATLTWTDNADGDDEEDEFTVEYGTDGTNFPNSIVAVTDATSRTVGGLAPNTLYYFRIAATNSGGSATSDSVSTTTLVGGPPVPTNVNASSIGTASVTISWADNSSADDQEDNFYLKYGTDGVSYGTIASTTAPDTTSATVTGLTPGQRYYFMVVATNISGSASSTDVIVTMLPATPGTPTLENATATTIDLTIDTNGNYSDVDFAIFDETLSKYINTVSKQPASSAGWQTSAQWGTPITIQGLAPNTNHVFKVRARNPNGDLSAFSATTSLYTLANTPASLAASVVSTSSITLTWTANNNPSGTVYEVYNVTDGEVVVTTTAVSYLVEGLDINTGYRFKVRAENAGNAGTYSSYTSETAILYTLAVDPGTPTLSAITTSSFAIELNANGNPSNTTYAIRIGSSQYLQSGDGSLSATTDYQQLSVWNTPTYSGLSPNTQYTVTIRAQNGDGIPTDFGSSSSTYTLAEAPTSLATSSVSQTAITITWDGGNNPGTTVYTVADSASTTIATTTAETYSYSSLVCNTTYTFKIKATNADDVDTAWTDTLTQTTSACDVIPEAEVPTNLTTSSVSQTAITITWDGGNNPNTTVYTVANSASTTIATTTAETYTYSSLTCATSYTFKVKATNSESIDTAWTDTLTVTTSDCDIITSAPTSLTTSSVSQTAIALSWNRGDNINTTVYTIANSAGTTIATTTAGTYTYSSLTCATSYTFKVKATDVLSVDTAWTDVLTVTTNACDVVEEETPVSPQTGAASPPPTMSIPIPVSLSVNGQTVNIDTTEQSVEGGDLLVEADIVEAKLKPNNGFKLLVQEEIHSVQLIDIKNKTAILEIRSSPVTIALKQKQEAVVDTDEDQIPDLHIYLKDISLFQTKATAVVTNLHKLPVSLNNHVSETTMRDIIVRLISIPQVTHVALSEDKNFSGVSYVPFEEARLFRLSSGYGKKTVYVKFRTIQGAEAVTSAQIALVKASNLVEGSNCPLILQRPYKVPNSNAVYYLTTDCTKRAFTSASLYFTYFDSWDDVETVEAQTLASIPQDTLGFMPYGPLYDPHYGALVKSVYNPKVYLLVNGKKHWIDSEQTFMSFGYSWNWIEDVDQSLLDALDGGEPITLSTGYPAGLLIKYAGNPKVYLLEQSSSGKLIKRHIADMDAFDSLGYRWDRIVTIPNSVLFETGSVLYGETVNIQSNGGGLAVAVDKKSLSRYLFTKYLAREDYDPEVIQLQTVLKNLGYFTHPYITDYFGPATEEAVKKFQHDHGLDPIGVVGPGTRRALHEI